VQRQEHAAQTLAIKQRIEIALVVGTYEMTEYNRPEVGRAWQALA
jgi:hypothetical protein